MKYISARRHEGKAMAKGLRPRTLAVGFGVYYLVIAFAAWGYAQGVAAIFLVGMGGLGVSVRRSVSRQIGEVDRRSGSSRGAGPEALPPPLPETPTGRDNVDRDIDQLLESLSEIEQSTAQGAAGAMPPAPPRATTRTGGRPRRSVG